MRPMAENASPQVSTVASATKTSTEDPERPLVVDTADLPRGTALALAAVVGVLFLFVLPPLSKSGLWDPYELNVADLGRRIALNLFHADELALVGADNSLPHLNDLGRPELPFTSIALGFKLFGLHEWAGRLPLAVWGLAGVLGAYGSLARLTDRRTGVYAAVVLSTMPLYLVQARTMLGDVVTMACLVFAFGGMAVGAFERTTKGWNLGRLAWATLGFAALVGGYYSRGLLLGVAIPALAVGLAWGVTWLATERKVDMLGDVVGAVALLVGVVAVWRTLRVTGNATDLSMPIGAMLRVPSKYPTFDFFIGHLGPAAAPWSAFYVVSVGRLFVTPVGRKDAALTQESYLRLALLVGGTVAFVAHGWLAARTDLVPFVGVIFLAATCAVAIRDYERGAHPSVAMAVIALVFLGVFHHDFHELPEKAYQAFGVANAPFPESFKERALSLWTFALIGFAILGMLTLAERDPKRKPFDPATYAKVLRDLRVAWDGLLSLGYFALVAGASLAGLIVFIGMRAKMAWVGSIALQTRDVILNLWWITALAPLGVILGILYALDVWAWAFGAARPFSRASFSRGFEPFEELFAGIRDRFAKKDPSPWRDTEFLVGVFGLVPFMVLALPAGIFAYLATHGVRTPIGLAIAVPSSIALFLALGALGDLLKGRRAAGFATFAAALGLVLGMGYFPALANQLSPKEVFESYQKVHKPGEPLALFGVGGRTAAYYAGGQPEQLSDTQRAFDWLVGGGNGRRFLAIRAEELAKLNQLYRARNPGQNLPVLDARSSQILLVASGLEGEEKNQNPLGKIILDKPPTPQHVLNVDMEGKLMVLGYDLTDQNGRLVDSVAPGRKYHFKTYYRVLAPVTTEWEGFIHIDGYRRRHNGDHKPMDGKYPFGLWLKDDLLLDDHEFSLEPNFSPGVYTIFFGLFVGDTRMKVVSGPNDGDNRINGGPLKVQ
jgi:4-amino-4-deoxy-L-arabinose transferase-like glycosyltransferase